MRHARDCLDFEDSLRLGAQRDCCFKGVLDAMAAQKLKQVGRILVDNNVRLRNMYSKAIRQKLFSFLIVQLISQTRSFDDFFRTNVRQTLAKSVFNKSDRFFSDASARGTSITSAICFPSLSRKRALNEPAGPAATALTSCCIWVLSRFSRFWRFDGGGRTVAMVSCDLAWTIYGISIDVLKVRDRMEWWGRLAKNLGTVQKK
jgi:hypothetical protein